MQHKEKTKILYFITKGVWGGAQKYVYSLATNLSRDRFDVIVVCGEGGILKEKLEADGIRVIELKNLKRDISFFDEFKTFFTFYKIIKNEKPNVIHLNSAKASGLGALAGRLLCVQKIIFTAHGWAFNEDRSLMSKTIRWIFSWCTAILSHTVISIATKEKQQANSMPFISSKKITLIHNGIEKIDFKDREMARKELLPSLANSYENDTVWIGTIAELHKNKAHSYLISALSKVNHPFVCIIIGDGEERKNLEKLIQTYRLEEKIFLVGFKDNASVYLKAFDVFTLISKKEGLPYGILEAGQASLPVISSSVGGIPDIIENNVNGLLVKAENVHLTRDTIEHLIDNREARLELGAKLHKKVEAEFSIQQMLEKTIKIYS